ncbi:hypothetical protein, partial [Nonomuraea basaltis]|uniref:hypothetical protein n=1 Tax=Nonomuraea basaltis TaxID=2495887 RepID=UPI00197D14AB
ARVAVAASPVEALSEVACVPPAGPGSWMGAGPELSDPSAGVATAAPAAGGTPAATGAATVEPLAARALAVAGAFPFSSGARVCRLGEVSGERSVDVTLTTPEGAGTVVLAAVARMPAVSGEVLTAMRRVVATQVADATPTFSGRAAELDELSPPADVGTDDQAREQKPASDDAMVVPRHTRSATVLARRSGGAAAAGRGPGGAEAVAPGAGGADAEARASNMTAPEPELTLPQATPQQALDNVPEAAALALIHI